MFNYNVNYIVEASTVGYGHGPLSLPPVFTAQPFFGYLALHATVACVILHARALASAHYIIVARVNYELRKIVSEDDLHTQRAARKGIDVRRASLPLCRREGNSVGRLKKKGSSVTGFLCTLKFPRSSAARWCPVYIVSREKEKTRGVLCVHQKFLNVLVSRRRDRVLHDNSRRLRRRSARYPSEFFFPAIYF